MLNNHTFTSPVTWKVFMQYWEQSLDERAGHLTSVIGRLDLDVGNTQGGASLCKAGKEIEPEGEERNKAGLSVETLTWFTWISLPTEGKDWRPEEKGIDRGWHGWRASPMRWTWVWVNSRSWWWTGMPGVLQPMGSQRVGHDWATELNWQKESSRKPWSHYHPVCLCFKWLSYLLYLG